MSVAIVAPSLIPLRLGPAERICRQLQDEINDGAIEQAEIIKLPVRVGEPWSLLDAYRRFAELDLSGFDRVVSMGAPAWMVFHRDHFVYLSGGWLDDRRPGSAPDAPESLSAEIADVLAIIGSSSPRRDVMADVLERLDQSRADKVPPGSVPLSADTVRRITDWFDAVGTHPLAVRGCAAATDAVRAASPIERVRDGDTRTVADAARWLVAT